MEFLITIYIFLFPITFIPSSNSAITTPTTIITTSTTIVPRHSDSIFQRKNAVPIRNVYRFELNEKNPHQTLATIQPTTIIKTSSSSTSVLPNRINQILTKTTKNNSNNEDKNWLLTKAWLIDNINRLRRELSELERDYSQHLDTTHRDNMENQKQLIEDIAKLRADHQFLSQQQKKIVFLIRKSNYFNSKSNDLKLKTKIADAPQTKRPIKRDLSSVGNIPNEKFESETRRNMKEVFAELSSLHDISLILFDDLKNLERKIEIRDKLLK